MSHEIEILCCKLSFFVSLQYQRNSLSIVINILPRLCNSLFYAFFVSILIVTLTSHSKTMTPSIIYLSRFCFKLTEFFIQLIEKAFDNLSIGLRAVYLSPVTKKFNIFILWNYFYLNLFCISIEWGKQMSYILVNMIFYSF